MNVLTSKAILWLSLSFLACKSKSINGLQITNLLSFRPKVESQEIKGFFSTHHSGSIDKRMQKLVRLSPPAARECQHAFSRLD